MVEAAELFDVLVIFRVLFQELVKEVVLLEQPFVKDPSKTVGKLFEEVGGKAVVKQEKMLLTPREITSFPFNNLFTFINNYYMTVRFIALTVCFHVLVSLQCRMDDSSLIRIHWF